MTQGIKEGFESIFEKLPSFAGRFNKDTYEESFKSLYQQFHSFLDELEVVSAKGEGCRITGKKQLKRYG